MNKEAMEEELARLGDDAEDGRWEVYGDLLLEQGDPRGELVALAFAEAAAAEVLLAVFMGAILVVWATEVADHAGWVPGHREVASHA